MSRLLKRASSRKVEQIGRVDLDSDVFTIAADGNLVLGLVNGFRVVDANLHQDPIPDIVPVMSSLIAKAFRDKWYEGRRVTFLEGEWDSSGKYPSKEFMEALMSHLEIEVGSSSVVVLNETPRELIPSPKVELNNKDLQNHLNSYCESLVDLLNFSERIIEKSEVLAKYRLVGTIWGIGEVINDLEKVRGNLDLLEDVFDSVGLNCNISRKSIARLIYRLQSPSQVTPDDKKYTRTILIPGVIGSFDFIKKGVAQLIKELYPLYCLEEKFRASTGNPMNWSIPGNLVEDFKEAYEFLLNFAMKIPSVELNVVEPLEQLSGILTEDKI